ncbi:hypothetical protein [Atopococcus tabaci]|uniref:hypothetical protein n=1 Tax=Atopococcus tabaci TaxID=269774 RepID=UPI0003F69B4A|nr:hypothetical protein [Atopococcus tabaci]
MDTELGMPIINKEPKSGLTDSLSSYTKSILFKVGDTLDASLKKSHKKEQLAEELERTILSRLEKADIIVPEADWVLLNELLDEPLKVIKQEELSTYSTLAEHGLVFVFRRGLEMQVSVPREIQDVMKRLADENTMKEQPVTETQIQEKAPLDENEAALLKMYESTKAIYGAANLTHLTQVWNDHHEVHYSLDDVRAIIETNSK